ncbi:MAG: outer membrane lipoprotein carrier protein LolA [Bacteroidota bacterium]
MKKYWIFALLLGFVQGLSAQNNEVSKLSSFKEESDPRSTAILKKVKDTYESYKSMEVAFTLTIDIPEQDTEVQKGSIAQKGDKYHLQLGSQEIISDGSTLWFHLKNNNEVQINSLDGEEDSEEILSPQALMRIYESDQYLSFLANEMTKNGKTLQYIEFKPTDRDSEYSKLKVLVNKKNNQVEEIMVFAKDGSRFTLAIDKLTPNKNFEEAYFRFDASKYPGIHVEDLRVD